MSKTFARHAAPFILLVALLPSGAFAHASFETAEARQNSYFKAVLRVPHGCNGEATNLVRITVPEGMIAVKPMPKAGWKLETKSGDLARTYSLHGKDVKNGVKEIVWSGGALRDEHYDEFVFQARVTDTLPAGEKVFVPVVQECANGQASWTDIPAKGQDSHALKAPAPGITILAQAPASGGHGHAHGHGQVPNQESGAEYRVGNLLIKTPWTRATPGGAKVGAGFMSITNTGSEADRLIGGSAEIAGTFELHEMKTEGTVMRMRALEKGLEIKPGETIELKPGGYHVMFLDLKKPFAEGRPVKGQLIFEKAGKIEIEYRVAPRGAAPGSSHH
ncbi:MAG: DUF1775 domain-containing protein [Proteobacteria bacterium]|nr:DUF1775 domain-containing protein [Pseudomonadota bacterium]